MKLPFKKKTALVKMPITVGSRNCSKPFYEMFESIKLLHIIQSMHAAWTHPMRISNDFLAIEGHAHTVMYRV